MQPPTTRTRRNLNSAVVRTEPIQLLQQQYQISNLLYTTSADMQNTDSGIGNGNGNIDWHAQISNEPSFLDFREIEPYSFNSDATKR